MTYSNRTKETSTSTSGSTITLAGATTGMRTFSASYAVGKARIPVYFGTSAAWMVCMCTLTDAVTLHVDKILITSLGNTTPPTFPAGAKDVFATEPAEYLNPQFVDLREFDVDPTFSNDSTSGIQAATLEAYNGSGPIHVPVGHFAIDGPLIPGSNSQIYIPNTRMAAHDRTVIFKGAHPPNFQQQGLHNVTPPNNGSLFESTIMGSGTTPAMIAGEPGNNADEWVWNYTNFGMTNMGLRTKANPIGGVSNNMGALNMEKLSQVPILDMLRIDVSRGLQDMVLPSGVGIMMPPIDNHAVFNGGLVVVSGYNNGVDCNEHTYFRNLILVGNRNGLVLRAANHASRIDFLQVEWCENSIVMAGNHALSVGGYSCEHNTGVNFSFQKDIWYIGGNEKVSFQHSHVVTPNVGSDPNAFTSNNANCYKVLVGAGAN